MTAVPQATAASAPRRFAHAAATWLSAPAGRRVGLAAVAALAGQVIFAAYEVFGLGLPLVRESAAAFAPHQLAQTLFILVLAVWLVDSLVRARAQDSLLDRSSAGSVSLTVGAAAIAAGLVSTCLFLADRDAFHLGAQEDRPLEWASALLLLVAAAGIGFAVRRYRLRPVVAAAGALILLALVLIAMEEISWGQRLLGFATPDALAEVNWQAEFNLHNVQTDLSETVYYVGAIGFLALAPLLRDLLPLAATRHPLLALVPGRGTALAAAPAVWMNYGHWNLYSVQLATWLALAAYAAWAAAAWKRGHRGEAAAFLAAAAAAIIGQALFLAFGRSMIDVPDVTEYKEFFIALAFAVYAASVVRSPVSGATAA
ncbi:hypothetical protein [Sphingosinicella terrae]|uniref:hypothetical protein n=1 Tax=Sphingosinicella terrae TaxID=2172047 RepID=UPI000E0CFEED|nr:hypothetical protein [Sphingosinicella terrae]